MPTLRSRLKPRTTKMSTLDEQLRSGTYESKLKRRRGRSVRVIESAEGVRVPFSGQDAEQLAGLMRRRAKPVQ